MRIQARLISFRNKQQMSTREDEEEKSEQGRVQSPQVRMIGQGRYRKNMLAFRKKSYRWIKGEISWRD